MGAKEETLAKIQALTDEQLANRLVHCDRLENDPSFRIGAMEHVVKRTRGPINTQRLFAANTNIRNLVQAEIERRKGRVM